jgi:hypothetical protein
LFIPPKNALVASFNSFSFSSGTSLSLLEAEERDESGSFECEDPEE